MSGAIVQTAYAVDDSGGFQTTLQATLNGVTAGNLLVAFAGWADPAGTTTASANDGNAYSSGDSKRRETTDTQSSQPFYLENAGAGTHTVTVTFSTTSQFVRLRFVEISGIAAASALDQSTGAAQTNPTTDPDAISSGATAATTHAADFILGLTQNCGESDPGTSVITAGTGFTLSGSNNMMACEGKSVSSTGAQTATFTQDVNRGRTTHVLAFKENSLTNAIGTPSGVAGTAAAGALIADPRPPPPYTLTKVTG